MKSPYIGAVAAGLLMAGMALAQETPPVELSDFSVQARIEGENIIFDLGFKADVRNRHARIPLLDGDVAYLDSNLPRNAEVSREGSRFFLEFPSRGSVPVAFTFASRPVRDGDWRQTAFTIPMCTVRRLSVICDRDDLEVAFPGALDAERGKNEKGQTVVTAYLGAVDRFEVRWKPEVRKLEAELIVACEANTIAAANVGALRLDTILTYRVVQGVLQKMVIAIPPSLNVTEVNGPDIQDWKLEDQPDKSRRLAVALRRPCEDTYRLQVNAEMVLPPFPARCDLPVIMPQGVIRTSGFLGLGTDSAIKLIVSKMSGLTQVDQSSFPDARLTPQAAPRPLPTRNAFAYQYANMPYALVVDADDITPEYSSENRLVLAVDDSDLVLTASAEVEFRDAPAREIAIEVPTNWIVASVVGKAISDYDVRDAAGTRVVHLHFQAGMLGRSLIDLRLERPLGAQETAFAVPAFRVVNAKSERGYIVLTAEKGLRVKTQKLEGLREVHTGSLPMRVAGAQQAFRFREPGWSAVIEVERTAPVVYSEIFNLISAGDGVLYGSASLTYHIRGAPTRQFRLRIPAAAQNVEFSGRDVRGWSHEGEEWTVTLQEKVLDDYTLLVTYDRKMDYESAELTVGGIQTVATESEVGYVVLASDANLVLSEVEADPAIIRIDREEIPQSYSLLINQPVIAAYKYVRAPHTAKVRIVRFDTESLLDQVLDHTTLATTFSEDGEAVTTVSYFLKNASQQYLAVRLPQGSRLWSAELTDENGNVKQVAALKGEQATLIPVGRPRDPNVPLQVAITYAQSLGRVGRFGSRIRLEAPAASRTQATYANWIVNLPRDFEGRGLTGGTMAPDELITAGGLEIVLRNVLRIWSGALGAGGAVVGILLVLLAAGIVLFNTARRSGRVWGGILAVFLAAVGLVLLAASLDALPGMVARLSRGGRLCDGSSIVSFSKPINLSVAGPLTVRLAVIPAWLGASGSVGWLLVAAILGTVLVVKGIRLSRRPVAVAIGSTLLAAFGSGFAIGRVVLTTGLAVAVPVLVAAWFLKACWRKGVRRRLPPEAAPVEEPPFAPAAPAPAEYPGLGGAADPGKTGFSTVRTMLIAFGFAVCAALALGTAARGEPQAPPVAPAPAPALSRETAAPQTNQAPRPWYRLGRGSPPAAPQGQPILPAPQPVKPADTERVSLNAVSLTVEGSGTAREDEKSARVVGEFEFSAEAPTSFPILDASAVVTDFEPGSRYLRLRSQPGGYVLDVLRRGDFKAVIRYLVAVTGRDGAWALGLSLPPNLKNTVLLRLPDKDLDVRSDDAVLLTQEEKDGTIVTAAFGPAPRGTLTWQPRVRKTKLEKVLFFCEVNTLALFEPGVVELTNLLQFQIAQGEIKSVVLTVPAGMSVASVSAPGLGTWRFDPETHQLEAILGKPVSGDFNMVVVTQIPREGLPYEAAIGTLAVRDAARQRGSIAISVPETVQVAVDQPTGLSAMNIADFSPETLNASVGRRVRESASVKRAFRYHELPVSAVVKAEKVLPELKVAEKATLSIADERIVLSSQLDITIAKAGVFSVRLDIPEDFDVESLSGSDVSHWDEVKEGGHGIVVHFQKQALGKKTLNLVIARAEKGIEETIPVPRVDVAAVRKHEGTLVVSGERGVRLTTQNRDGVSDLNPRDLGIREAGVLAFRILRPGWQVALKTEVLAPTVKPDVLHRVDLAEGMLHGTAFIQYTIENAGCKTFRLQAPRPGVTLTITGRNVAKVYEVDRERGIWQVDLHNKVEQTATLRASYQMPFDPAQREVQILPLKTVDTEGQKGYLVITSTGRVQVSPAGDPIGLKPEDARSIPPAFGAGDVSDAIFCYRTVLPDHRLDLATLRHGSAEVLPARVNQVRMTSVVSADGEMLTRVRMDVTVGDLRFLNMSLPGTEDRLWSVFVNGKVARPSRDGRAYRIPLGESLPGETTSLDLVYAGPAPNVGRTGRQTHRGPQFNLPLNDVEWSLYLQPGRFYYGFDGTLKLIEKGAARRMFDQEQYTSDSRRQIETSLQKAKAVMAQGEQYVREGKQKQARQALEAAMNYSQAQADFNEDARIQYRNLVKQQGFVGLVQRRNEMRAHQDILDEQQMQQAKEFRGGQFTADYASKIEQSLPAEESASLQTLATKILDQQAAAAAVAHAIRITLPEQGTRLVFQRPVQINPNADMSVKFRALDLYPWRRVASLWAGAVLLIGLIAGLRRAMKPAARMA